MYRVSILMRCSTLWSISRAALLVKVSRRIALRGDAPFEEMGDPIGDDPRLAASGSCYDEDGSVGRRDDLELLLVEFLFVIEARLPGRYVAV